MDRPVIGTSAANSARLGIVKTSPAIAVATRLNGRHRTATTPSTNEMAKPTTTAMAAR